jgi:ribosome recycling factor
MQIETLPQYCDATLNKVIGHLNDELARIRAGKASPNLVSDLKVDYYGTPTSLSQIANVSAADSKTLTIQPWEKSMLAIIEQAIFQANLGITPMNDGETIRLTIPPVTEDRRRDLGKQAKAIGEDAKVSIRNDRQKMMTFIKNEVKDGLPEDTGKKLEATIQKIVNDYGDKVDKLIAAKEQEIMKV